MVLKVVCESLLHSLRSAAQEHAAEHGLPREISQVEIDFREYIHFEASIVMKAVAYPKYSFDPNDYNDQMLCAYPGLGYVIVTEDARFRQQLKHSGCPEPRVVNLAAALAQLEGTDG